MTTMINDGVVDLWDSHPWDSTVTTNITDTASMWDNPLPWDAKETITISLAPTGINPQFYNIEVGDTVVWVNDDSGSHKVTADDGTFDLSLIQISEPTRPY